MIKGVQKSKDIKHRAIRQKIFDSAAGLIKENDYADITIRAICEESGTSIGMFYRCFKSKDDVLSFFYDQIADEYKPIAQDAPGSPSVEYCLTEYYSWVACSVANFGLEFVRHFLNPNNISIKSDYAENQIVNIGMSILDEAVTLERIELSADRTVFDITHDILVIVKGALLDWAISGGRYDISEYMHSILKKTVKNLL